MKTILKSALIVLAIAVSVGSGTVAYFSDSETSVGNTFTAGTLDLVVDAQNSLTTALTVGDVAPGYQSTEPITVSNGGSITGDLTVRFDAITDIENGCNEPESLVDTTCGNPGTGAGELSTYVDVKVYTLGADVAVATPVYTGTVAGLVATPPIALGVLAGGETKTFFLTLEVSPTIGNIIQSDAITIDVVLDLEQQHS